MPIIEDALESKLTQRDLDPYRNEGAMDSSRSSESREEQVHTVRQMSEYFLELENILARIETSFTHYQVLGLDKAASAESVKSAYSQAVAVLKPPSKLIDSSLAPEVTARIEAAFEKVGQALSVLSNYGKRIDYDNSLTRKNATPLPLDLPIGFGNSNNRAQEQGGDVESNRSPNDVAIGFSKEKPEANRRRCERFNLGIPVRVSGQDEATGKWAEMAQTLNVTRLGISAAMRHRLRHGTVVHLTMPLPVKLRNHGHADPSYSVYAIVRRIEPSEEGIRLVGFEFLGEHPPRGYLERPWKVFRTVKWVGQERRREPRRGAAEPLEVQYLDETYAVFDCQLGLIENVSQSGARVYVRTAPPEFDWIRVVARNRNFESRASLRNRFTAADGYDRLCLMFLDSKWPL